MLNTNIAHKVHIVQLLGLQAHQRCIFPVPYLPYKAVILSKCVKFCMKTLPRRLEILVWSLKMENVTEPWEWDGRATRKKKKENSEITMQDFND